MAVRSRYLAAGLALVALILWLGINADVVKRDDGSVDGMAAAKDGIDLSLSKQFMPVAHVDASRDIFSYVRSNQENSVSGSEVSVAQPVRKAVKRPSYNRSDDKSSVNSLKLVGMLLKHDDRLAFVIYRGKPYTLREAEILGGRYEVLAISQTALNLRNRQNNKTFVITL